MCIRDRYYYNNLIIPHPRAKERDFVLYPILDIKPFLLHPVEKKFKIKNIKIKINKTAVAKKYGAESVSVSN